MSTRPSKPLTSSPISVRAPSNALSALAPTSGDGASSRPSQRPPGREHLEDLRRIRKLSVAGARSSLRWWAKRNTPISFVLFIGQTLLSWISTLVLSPATIFSDPVGTAVALVIYPLSVFFSSPQTKFPILTSASRPPPPPPSAPPPLSSPSRRPTAVWTLLGLVVFVFWIAGLLGGQQIVDYLSLKYAKGYSAVNWVRVSSLPCHLQAVLTFSPPRSAQPSDLRSVFQGRHRRGDDVFDGRESVAFPSPSSSKAPSRTPPHSLTLSFPFHLLFLRPRQPPPLKSKPSRSTLRTPTTPRRRRRACSRSRSLGHSSCSVPSCTSARTSSSHRQRTRRSGRLSATSLTQSRTRGR